MSNAQSEDDQLLAELGEALVADAQSAEREAMLMVGYDMVMDDGIEAKLVHDTLNADLAPVRSAEPSDQAAGTRHVVFATSEVEIEVEITEDRLLGHIDPPQPGVVHVEFVGGSVTTTPDDLGAFETDVPRTTFRIRLAIESSDAIITGWVDANP